MNNTCPRCNAVGALKHGKERWNGKHFTQMMKCGNCGHRWEVVANDQKVEPKLSRRKGFL